MDFRAVGKMLKIELTIRIMKSSQVETFSLEQLLL